MYFQEKYTWCTNIYIFCLKFVVIVPVSCPFGRVYITRDRLLDIHVDIHCFYYIN